MGKGTLYWITGLSGAGKTTIGNALYYELKKKQDNLIILDGDILKKLVGNSLGYSQSDRKKRAYYYSNLCKTLTDQGISVVICTIAMYDEVRDWNRANIEKYVEIFLNVNKDILMKRDRKGLYSGQSTGKIENVAGMDQDVEFPKNPDIIIENDGTITISDCVNKIMEYKVNVKDTFDRDVNYWNQYYLRKEKEIQEPSDFAKFVLPYMEKGTGQPAYPPETGRRAGWHGSRTTDLQTPPLAATGPAGRPTGTRRPEEHGTLCAPLQPRQPPLRPCCPDGAHRPAGQPAALAHRFFLSPDRRRARWRVVR